jgi:hypothetical protein
MAILTSYRSVDLAVRYEFPGKGNVGLRKRLRELIADGIPVGCLSRSVALTACGTASLDEVERAQIQFDNRLAYLRKPEATVEQA